MTEPIRARGRVRAPRRPPVRPYDAALLRVFLSHLSYEPGPAPSVAELTRLHRAYLDRVPYENLEIQLGRPTTVDPHESARRIVTGRGGYCFHLNGAFAALLVSLGYDVTLARGKLIGDGESGWGKHMVLLVRLPDAPPDGVLPPAARTWVADLGRTWVADVGLGDGFRDPLPLAEGEHRQGPFRYRLEHAEGALWRFHHDERASIAGVDLDVTPATLEPFEAQHRELSTSPESSFVRVLVVQARRADHTLILRGCLLTRVDNGGVHRTEVAGQDEWYDLLTGEFGLRLADVDREARAGLWQKVRTGHEAWVAAGRP